MVPHPSHSVVEGNEHSIYISRDNEDSLIKYNILMVWRNIYQLNKEGYCHYSDEISNLTRRQTELDITLAQRKKYIGNILPRSLTRSSNTADFKDTTIHTVVL